jgi:hypothetical protein
MRRFLILSVVLLVGAAAVSAAPRCAAGQNVLEVGFTCESLGGLTFTNFFASAVGFTPAVGIGSVVDATGGVVLNFITTLVSQNMDMWFAFQVTGYVTAVDLTNAGIGTTSIAESVCDSAGLTGANLCAGSELATLMAGSSQSVQASIDPQSAGIWVWKDIGTGSDGHLSSFSQSFESVPEPMTFGLIGSGLLLLGLLRRRTRG